MTVIGLTGPSGAGKGQVSRIMSEYCFHIIDSDAVYHNIVSSPSPCVDELKSVFGQGVVNHDGALNRAALSAIVFKNGNQEKLSILNSITHKYVVIAIRDTISKLKDEGARVCVIDAPLLIEAGLLGDCDFSIAVLADKKTRIKRICERDGIDITSATSRIISQKNDEYYISNTDEVIYNDGDMSDLEDDVKAILEERGVI